MALVEAMLSGLPVIATNWSGYRDIVVDRQTGFLIDTWIDDSENQTLAMMAALGRDFTFEGPMAQNTFFDVQAMRDAMVFLLHDPAARDRMGRAGRSRALELFSADMVMPAFSSMWEQQLLEAQQTTRDRRLVNIPGSFSGFPSASCSIEELGVESTAAADAVYLSCYRSMIEDSKDPTRLKALIKNGTYRLRNPHRGP